MLWVLTAVDHAKRGHLRSENRDDHLAWLAGSTDRVVRAGPLVSDDGSTMTGSMLVLDFPDRDSVEAWAAGDPYRAAGLFESVSIKAWKEAIRPPPCFYD